MMRVLNRDPFARIDYVRETIPSNERTTECAWCGTARAKYRYGTHSDGVGQGPYFDRRPFCTKGCRDAFNA